MNQKHKRTGEPDWKSFAGDKKVGQSILHGPEQRLVAWGTPKIPRRIETWHLTMMTVPWSMGAVLFGYLAQWNIHWLWGTSAMIILQYLTDLFDGAVGRLRGTGLIKWGFYTDHFLDYIFMSCVLIGYSFFISDPFNELFFVMMAYGAIMVSSYTSFAATNRFKISFFGIGPTEARLGFIFVNTMLILMGKVFLSQFLPVLLVLATVALCLIFYRSQRQLWKMDMEGKEQK
jgi:phosphatidylglycerophosphate synthase